MISLIDKMSLLLVDTILFTFTIEDKNIQVILESLVTLIFLVISGFVLKKINAKGIRNVNIKWIFVFTVLTIADTVVLVLLSDFAESIANINNNIRFQIFFAVVILGTFLQIALVLLLMVSRNAYAEKEAIAKKFLEEQKDYYKYLELREKETKKFRHDSRDHIHMLNILYEQGNKDEFLKYLNKLTDKIENFGNQVSVSNDIVDAILNKYYTQAEKENIKLCVKGKFPRECSLDTFDLCIIFSNILKNAIEAEKKTTANQIELNCGYNENEILISCQNDYVGNLVIEDGMIKTNKQDKLQHGWGLENVQECVNRNSGVMNITTENNKFKIVIIIANEDRYGKNSNNR